MLPPTTSSQVPPPADPPIVLDYGHARPRAWGERVALVISGLITGTIGIGLAAALIEIEILTWPSFAMALAAVPIGLIAAGFLLVANTAIKTAFQAELQPARGRTFKSSPTE